MQPCGQSPYAAANAEKEMIVDRVDELCRPCRRLGFAQQPVAETEAEAEVGAEPAVAVACKAGACEQGRARFEVEVEILLYVDTGLILRL